MARLNPNPTTTPTTTPKPARAWSAPSPTSSRRRRASASEASPQTQTEEQKDEEGGLERSADRPRLIIARAPRDVANLTIRKKTSRGRRPDLGRAFPFLENVVYIEVPYESEEDEADVNEKEESGYGYGCDYEQQARATYEDESNKSSMTIDDNVDFTFDSDDHGEGAQDPKEDRGNMKEEERGQEDGEDDSAYGSIDIPDAACPTFITRQDSWWTYDAICAWRKHVSTSPPSPAPSPPKTTQKIAVSKRLMPKTPGKSPGKRLLTF